MENLSPSEPRIVTATGAAVTGTRDLSKRLERAMSDAVLEAAKDGVTDPEEVNRRMVEARRKLMREARAG